ncbi:sensor histidine kinase [Streptococcus suis]|uniref:sensor histidine kinase n=1 Tax=Streptococcus suis TaxID=1307 RepID=UPI001583415C|nr:sensor histidine kinase [Streptococcus suis]MCQ8271441.1 ATP-binding protein [Streptococcus suis]MDY7600780.1 sensor histidine kinase [Streptococcus suis]UUM48985.1 ATP-binding protein [Streptococcus suis]HEL1769329.1 sensor histidine kinase [Streptococcus suis]HEL1782206.1 sensor histidine kinase [Streptococcus suis]
MGEFTFRTNSKLKTLVGQELITNNNIAIFELIKNSYDAGATRVNIEFHDFEVSDKGWISSENSSIKVIDNGVGMTTQQIDKYWMELGNSSKENNKFFRVDSQKMGKLIERFANGEKGIGRFGVDKIGSGLILESIGRSSQQKTTVNFDWNKYDDHSKLLQDIKNEYFVEDVSSDSEAGLSLTIINLRDKWTQVEIDKLKKDISKFLSPNPVESNEFKIFVSFHQNNNLIGKEEIKNDSFNYLRCKINTKLFSNGYCELKIFSDGEAEYGESFQLFNGSSPIGKISLEIYYLDRGDKSLFTRRMGIRPYEYGNIKVFRDNFRIVPYGEPHNDWLEIDKKHAQGLFRTFGTRDLVGNVFLDGQSLLELGALKEATDRVGFIEDTNEFEILKDFIWKNISVLERYVFNQIKKETKEASEAVKEEAREFKSELNTSLSSFREMIKESDILSHQKDALLLQFEETSNQLTERVDAIDRAAEEVDNKIKIYAQLSNKEGILYEMLHSIKNKLVIINNQIDLQVKLAQRKGFDIDLGVLKASYQDIEKLVNGSLEKVNSSKLRKSNYKLIDILTDFKVQNEATFIQEGIFFIEDYQSNIVDMKVFCSEQTMKTIFDNLLNNSIKALNGFDNKLIKLTIKSTSKDIQIYFSDNGCGIPKERASSIFTLWSSSTDGTGIGLASVKENLADIGGEIHLVDLNDKELTTTFMINLPRR